MPSGDVCMGVKVDVFCDISGGIETCSASLIDIAFAV